MRQKKKKNLLYASSLSKLTPFSELPTSVIKSFNKHGLSMCRAVLMVGGGHTGSLPAGAHPQALVHPREGLSLKADNRFLLLCPLPQHSHPGFSPSPSRPPIPTCTPCLQPPLRPPAYFLNILLDFLVAQRVKSPPAMQEAWVRSLGQEDSLE